MAWDESESKLTIVFAKIFKNVFAKIIKNVFTKTINVSFVPIVDHSRASASAAWYKPALVLLLGDRWVIPVFICQNQTWKIINSFVQIVDHSRASVSVAVLLR